MRIVHIASVIDIPIRDCRGGRERVIYLLAKKQAEKGHHVTIIGASSGYIEKYYMVSVVKSQKFPRNKIAFWFFRRLKETEHSIRAYKWIASNYDVVHNHVEYEGVAFSFLNKTPSITTLHGPLYSNFYGSILAKLYGIPRKTKLVAVSRHAYTQFRAIYGKDLIGYVYNGIDVNTFPFVSEPIREHDLQLCWIGRIIPAKGAHIAINVAERLHKLGYDVHLKLIGVLLYMYYKYFLKIVQEVKKRPYISIKVNATREEIIKCLGNSDATLFPILWDEPFGLVMAESMACGTPVLAFRRGSTAEIIQNGINGFLCNSIDDMVHAALNVSKIDRKQCRYIAEKKFGTDAMYEGYLRMYEKVFEML